MDIEKRRQLEDRRAALLAEAKLRARLDRIRARTDVLDAHGVAYDLLLDDRTQVDWVWRHFPRGGGLLSARIDWPRVPVCEMGPESHADDVQAAAWLAGLAAKEQLRGEVVLLNGNGVDPAIRMAFRDLEALPAVVTCGMDIWIVNEADGWAIEFLRFEHGWWWGRASAVADEP
jgi:hypothetical protein